MFMISPSPAEPPPQPSQVETVTGAIGRLWINLLVAANRSDLSFGLSDPPPKVVNKLLKRGGLRCRRARTVEVTDQTNPDRDAVEVIARNMTAVDLTGPSAANLNLAVAGAVTSFRSRNGTRARCASCGL